MSVRSSACLFRRIFSHVLFYFPPASSFCFRIFSVMRICRHVRLLRRSAAAARLARAHIRTRMHTTSCAAARRWHPYRCRLLSDTHFRFPITIVLSHPLVDSVFQYSCVSVLLVSAIRLYPPLTSILLTAPTLTLRHTRKWSGFLSSLGSILCVPIAPRSVASPPPPHRAWTRFRVRLLYASAPASHTGAE